MPFNSRYNDYMMVIDEEKGVGWFATDRYMPNNRVCVYTFIPNAVVDILESGDTDYLAGRARISSIEDTWLQGKDYTSVIALARKEIIEQKEVQRDFEFVINDRYTYYKYNDFKNSSARDLYRKVREKQTELSNAESDLFSIRENYMTVSQSDKGRLSNQILNLEQLVSSLKDEIYTLEISARNEEIKLLESN
jgi:hypothetical protein